MREEPVDQITVRAIALDTVTIADQHHTLPHRPSPGTPDLSVTAPAPRWGMSRSPGVSPGEGRLTGTWLIQDEPVGVKCRRNRGWRASQAWMTGPLCVDRLSQTRCTSKPAGTAL